MKWSHQILILDSHTTCDNDEQKNKRCKENPLLIMYLKKEKKKKKGGTNIPWHFIHAVY